MNRELIEGEPKLHKWRVPMITHAVIEAETPDQAVRELRAAIEQRGIFGSEDIADDMLLNAELDLEVGITHENHNNN